MPPVIDATDWIAELMAFSAHYRDDEPTRDEVNQTSGLLLLEFGASWCGHCIALSPAIEQALAKHTHVQHLRIADGRGKPLGRSFRVKLWPTLIFLHDGEEFAELVRPTEPELRGVFSKLPQP